MRFERIEFGLVVCVLALACACMPGCPAAAGLEFFADTVRAPGAQATARAMPSAATATMKSISSGVMQYGGMK